MSIYFCWHLYTAYFARFRRFKMFMAKLYVYWFSRHATPITGTLWGDDFGQPSQQKNVDYFKEFLKFTGITRIYVE